jgi:hypothetical protein
VAVAAAAVLVALGAGGCLVTDRTLIRGGGVDFLQPDSASDTAPSDPPSMTKPSDDGTPAEIGSAVATSAPSTTTAALTTSASSTTAKPATPSPTGAGTRTSSTRASTTAPPAPRPAPPTAPAGYPNSDTTGPPAGASLPAYTGPCRITQADTIIDGRTINCDLEIRTSGVVIRNSKLNGSVSSGTEPGTGWSFSIEDSEMDVTPGYDAQKTGVEAVNFRVLRTEIYGGNRSINCQHNCLVEDSYVHGQDTDVTGVWHESGIRMGAGAVLRGNTILCDAPDVPPDAGCSASLTGYGDFATIENNLIEGNYFPASTGGFCAYGGSTSSKPHPDANRIVFRDNVFERGPTGKCGWWGAITDFDVRAPGNQWVNNVWDDGTPVTP